MSQQHDHTLDTTGLYCPEPVMLLHSKIREVNQGDIIKVIATDPSTERDIPKFCNYLGHTLIDQQKTEDQYIYLIEKQ